VAQRGVAFPLPGGLSTRRTLYFFQRVHCPAAERFFMQMLFSRCCGIDVQKDSVIACVLIYSTSPAPEVRKKEFETHKKALGNLRLWLHAKVTHVAMESTGVYWKPV
jgi:hypothetical protein